MDAISLVPESLLLDSPPIPVYGMLEAVCPLSGIWGPLLLASLEIDQCSAKTRDTCPYFAQCNHVAQERL